MKTELYRSTTVKISLISQSHQIKKKDNHERNISVNGELQVISWMIEGEAFLVWPNREGEGFTVSQALTELISLKNGENGLSISYPGTASVMAFLIKTVEGLTVLLYMDRDEQGRICEIRLRRENTKALSINITAIHKLWHSVEFTGEIDLSNLLKIPQTKKNRLKQQFQLGFIGPLGHCAVPWDVGFNVIPQLACLIKENFDPESSCIHLFGYGRGHDRLYPDYSPSEFLGGRRVLKSALNKTKDLGFEISFYLNGRIVDSDALSLFPSLKKALLRDNNGHLIEEIYQNRVFYVVNPSSSIWENCLLEWARFLADCGADTVQLDQLGGRAAVLDNGEIWGEGYNRIIDGIHEMGMKVWIQGVSDFFRADRFEMTFRKLNILEGGILRGGNPFGISDLSLLNIFAPNGTFIATESKLKGLENKNNFDFIIDYPDYKGQLPLYSDQYMKMLTNAGAALR